MQRLSCPCVCHEGIWGSTGTAPLTLNLSTKWSFMVGFLPRPSCPRKKRVPPTQWMSGWTPELVWKLWRREKSLNCPACSLVTTLSLDFRLPPRCWPDLRSSGISRGIVWQLFTDVSGKRIGPILKGHRLLTIEDGNNTVVNNYHKTTRNIPEECRSTLSLLF